MNSFVRWSVLLGLLALLATACRPFEDRQLRTEGAGAQLYSELTSETTKNLELYFWELCNQADFTTITTGGQKKVRNQSI